LDVLDLDTRSAILRLRQEGHGTRFIARAVGVSRDSVQKVLASGRSEVPAMERPEQLTPWLDKIQELHRSCLGNLIRVHEELGKIHVAVPYSTLTRFCREHKIGHAAPVASGRYVFQPGEEMQHDTSPHRVVLGGKLTALQCASLVLCFSHRRFIQNYPRFNRFYAKVFLTEAIREFDGAANKCMLDNSTVIMEGGTGTNAHPVPEMAAFQERFGFKFVAHAKGDANRSARVEAPFYEVENNFYAGRTFADLADLNTQLRAWCETYNRKHHKSYQGVPMDMYAIERPLLAPLPPYIPEPTDVHPRTVDAEGYVWLHTNRYSVPEDLIGQMVEVHETISRVRVFLGHHLHATHDRKEEGLLARVTLPEHRRRWHRTHPAPPSPEEITLSAAGPAMAALCAALRTRHGGQAIKAMRRLHRMWLDYPTDAVLAAVSRALDYTLCDLDRIERMILANVHNDFFRLPMPEDDPNG
jgi:transposase